MSGFAFAVHPTTEHALAFLERSPLASGDSQWLEAHLPLLRAQPARVLALFDQKAAQMQAELARTFPPDARCSLTGVAGSGPRDAASFLSRRRELLDNALASSTLGVREQTGPFELDIQTL